MKKNDKDLIDDVLNGINATHATRFDVWFRRFRFDDSITDAQYWYGLRNAYEDTDILKPYRKMIQQSFASNRPGKEGIMKTNEQESYAMLSDEFTVYRAMSTDELRSHTWGVGWTLDIKVAELFTEFPRCPDVQAGKKKLIVDGRIRKDDTLAYINGRNEQTLIILDAKKKSNWKVAGTDYKEFTREVRASDRELKNNHGNV